MKPLIVALDVETDKEALALVRKLRPYIDLFKVGPVLFLKYGGPLLEELHGLGAEIFLDLKFHDIPSVVAKAIERAGQWGVYSATLHAAGGLAMMREAAALPKRPRLWGVTVLTSLDRKDLHRLGIRRSVSAQVRVLALSASAAGLDGVIASAREAPGIKKACRADFEVVTPGIRLARASDDQKRVETPRRAMACGADYFVMGRPIVESKDPVAAVRHVYETLRRMR
jgi:orotidine-5'-phosphate decarboxylase